MLVYLIRHGETDLNKKKVLQGQSDFELNEYGRELAKVTGAALKHIRFDKAYTSPLKRAKETAQLFLAENENVRPELWEEKRIQEISFGDYEGCCYGKDTYNVPNPEFRYFFEAPEKFSAPPNGESFEDVIKRTGDFWKELISDPNNEDKTIFLSTHGCALKALLINIKKQELKDFWGEGVHKNCAVSLVEVKDGVATILDDGKIYYK
ncbi:MAG: histidine phosphatase family protein [Lachnospiraceae bacterium]|nr:histidine phosphatase family protein [Lachnospiraceae bacterium]